MSDRSLWASLRRYLLTGIVVIAPVGVTVFVLFWIFVRLDAILGRLLRELWGVRFPGLGLLALVILLLAVGWGAQLAMGRQMISLGRHWLSRFPLTRSIYSAASQIIETVVGDNRKLFKGCVLFEYPKADSWVLGFVTNRASREIDEITGEESLAVFVPTSPNPTSGFILFVPASRVRQLRMTVEEGFKLVISGGSVTPDSHLRPATLSDIRELLDRYERTGDE